MRRSPFRGLEVRVVHRRSTHAHASEVCPEELKGFPIWMSTQVNLFNSSCPSSTII